MSPQRSRVLPRRKRRVRICYHHFIADPLCPLLQELKVGLIVLEYVVQNDLVSSTSGVRLQSAAIWLAMSLSFMFKKVRVLRSSHEAMAPVIATDRECRWLLVREFRFKYR